MPTRWSPDFLDLLTALNAADARYLLIGGHAIGLFARPRATRDFDLWLEPSAENASRVVAALRAFGAPIEDLTEADLAVKGTGFRMGSPPFRVELLTAIDGVEFDTAWRRRDEHDLGGVRCHVISRDDLIANKRAAGRPQDLADVLALERAAKKT
jgi:hypothetical protein